MFFPTTSFLTLSSYLDRVDKRAKYLFEYTKASWKKLLTFLCRALFMGRIKNFCSVGSFHLFVTSDYLYYIVDRENPEQFAFKTYCYYFLLLPIQPSRTQTSLHFFSILMCFYRFTWSTRRILNCLHRRRARRRAARTRLPQSAS